MVDLLLGVLCSSLIFVVFKLFARFKVQVLYAIIVNYIVASSCGLIFSEHLPALSSIAKEPWFLGTVFLGMLFILVFNIMAKSSQRNGVGVTSVATKMSFVVPVVFAVVHYGDQLSLFKIIGIVLAVVSVYLSASQSTTSQEPRNKNLWLPLLVFLGSGVIDTCIKFIQEAYLTDEAYPLFSSTVFGAAALTGLIFVGILSVRNPLKVNFRNVLGGICLGIPNYFSIYFLLRALNHGVLDTSSVFTINNVAIILLSTLLGIALFREKLGQKNGLGILLAIAGILLVALF